MAQRPSKLDAHSAEIAEALANNSQASVAKAYGVARSTLQNWIEKRLTAPPAEWASDGLNEDPDINTEIPVFFRDYSDQEVHYVYPLGDVHKGAPGHNEARWHEWLGYLEGTPEASLLGTGDFLNCALKDSKSETYDESLTVLHAREALTDELAPLASAGRIDLLMPGNHEDRVYRASGDCPVHAIAGRLGVDYSRHASVVVYKVGNMVYTCYITHGKGGGQVGARANRLQKLSNVIDCDFYVSAHTHSELVFPQDKFVVNLPLGIVQRKRQMFISSGSFINYEEYASKAGYAPQKLGAPRVRLDGTKHDIHSSI